MKKSERLAVACLVSFLLAGCVQTTTTTGGARPDADDNDAAELNYQLGARYFRNGSYELARDRLLTSIELDPRNAVTHYTLALTYEALGNMRLATESYEESVRIAPRDHQVQNAYAVFLCKRGRFDDARRYFDRAAAIRTNDNAEVTLTNAGVCMMQQPDHAAAEGYFREALNHKANYGEALVQMAVLMQTTGEHLSARAFLQRFMNSNRTTAGVLYLAAEIEGKLGNDRGRTEFVNRLLREYSLQVNVGKPQVVYRETITAGVAAASKFDREIAGVPHYAHVELHLEPRPRGTGNLFRELIRDGSIPPSFIPAVEEGVMESLESGVIVGYPMVDVEVAVIGGTFKEQTASELAFKVAASTALQEGCRKAQPRLLEPIMSVEIIVPEEFTGEVINDLNIRKGKIEAVNTKRSVKVIQATVALSRMFGYSTALRSASQGRATFTMQFSHFDNLVEPKQLLA